MGNLYVNVPWLEPLTDKDTLRNLLRLIMVIGGYLLLRPYLDLFFRKLSGAPDIRQEQFRAQIESQARLQKQAEERAQRKKRS
jgi:hypothetical protein